MSGRINKREQTVLDAVTRRKDLTLWSPEGEAHDRVRSYGDGTVDYWLWRTRIATWRPETMTLMITLNGWTTDTTLHRADAFLEFFGAPFRVSRRKGEVSLVGVGADSGKEYELGRLYFFENLTVSVEA